MSSIKGIGGIVGSITTGIMTYYNCYKDGESLMTSLLCGTFAGVSSYFSINQIAQLFGVEVGKQIEIFSSLVFDAGGSLLSAATENVITAIAPDRIDKCKASSVSVKTKNTKAHNSKLYYRTGCKAPTGKVSSDYYYFMLYGIIR